MVDSTFASSFLSSSSSSPSSTLLLPLLATISILLASGIYWFLLRKDSSKTAATTTTATKHTTKTTKYGTSGTFNAATRLKNVWNTPTVGQPTLASSSSSSSSKERVDGSGKPFGSSYYYAHNNPNAKGGYKDGLKMEDYTMNGPRLLSKGGEPVQNNNSNSTDDDGLIDKENDQPDNSPPSSASNDDHDTTRRRTNNSTTSSIPIRSITKYLWDDPGDSTGIATIRIDSLPSLVSPHGANTPTMLEWKSVTIDQVEAELVGEGMVVRVHAQSPLALYELKIPKLYGEAALIQAIRKPKRLLIKIFKKKQQTSILFSSKHANSNLDAWPQPHRKL